MNTGVEIYVAKIFRPMRRENNINGVKADWRLLITKQRETTHF